MGVWVKPAPILHQVAHQAHYKSFAVSACHLRANRFQLPPFEIEFAISEFHFTVPYVHAIFPELYLVIV